MPSGFTVKGGRFFSGIGYLNEVHAHAWDFADQPLVYQAFMGNQLAQDGVQVKWLAPTDLFVEIGAETGNGQAFPGTRRNRNGMNGTALFAHVGGDLGDIGELARRRVMARPARGGSLLRGRQTSSAIPVLDSFTGKSRTWGVDAVLKWAPTGNSAYQQLKVQAEYMSRREDGELTFDTEWPGPRRCLSQRSIRLVPAERVPVPAALARRACDTTRSIPAHPRIALVEDGIAAARCVSRRCWPQTRNGSRVMFDWSPERILATPRAVRLGRCPRRWHNGPAVPSAIPLRHRRARRPQVLGAAIMKNIIRGVLALLIILACGPAQATVKILATTSDWGALATELGGDKVNVYVATTAMQDVHRVDAKPSLVARARTADLIVATGAELEIGWLPVLVQESGNPHIQPGSPGYFEAAAQLKLLEVPSRLDRSLGDIHPQGNPHLQLDPHNIAIVAKALTARLALLDAGNARVLPAARQ